MASLRGWRALRRPLLVAAAIAFALVRPAPVHAADTPPRALSLREAIALALGNHPARLAEQARVGQARERIGEAWSGLLPQVQGTAEYLRSTDNGVGTTVYWGASGLPRVPSAGPHADSLTETFDNYLGGVSAFQYLLDFGRRRGLVAERNAEADAEEARRRLVDLDLVYAVSKGYYALVAAREIVKVYDEAVTQRREHLHDAEVKAKAGLKPEIDVFTAKSELARAELNLVDARNAAATAKAELDNAMGVGFEAPQYDVTNVLTRESAPAAFDPLLASALAGRPDLAMLADEARAAGAIVQQVRSDYFPSLGAAAGIDVRGQGTDEARNGYAGLVIQWPLFNGFLTDHQLAEAKLKADEVRHTIDDVRQRVYLEVKSAFLEWHAADKRIDKAEQTLEASRAELELAQERYRTGLGGILELTDAQRRYTESNAAAIEALAGSSIAKAALVHAIGGPSRLPS